LSREAAYFKPGTAHAIGRVLFGLAVRKDSPAAPIASEAEFKAAIAGKNVLINDCRHRAAGAFRVEGAG
jgi:hypothetical protein